VRSPPTPGEQFAKLRVGAAIGDYVEQEARATAVYQHGHQAGIRPQAAAQAILRIIRTPVPARYYLVGREKWYARLAGSCRPRQWSRLQHAISR
jgi:hypothetical protein